MRSAQCLELAPAEGRTLALALELSGEDPHVLVPVAQLAEHLARPAVAVMRDVLLLEAKGLLEFTAVADGVYVTSEACRWAGVLQASPTRAREVPN